jgi:thioesterase domain-containing protein
LKNALQKLLNDTIPLTLAIGLRVEEAGGRVVLSAPLLANINHVSTAFGGSQFSAAVLSGWSWIWVRMQEDGLKGDIMIRRSDMDYTGPVDGDFSATCEGAASGEWQKALMAFQRRDMARVSLRAEVASGGKTGATFSGDYVMVRAAQAKEG